MLAYRLISGDSLLRTRSFCVSCNQDIAWYDLIPIISWFLLKGHCRNCSQPISLLYPFIELISVVFFSLLLIYAHNFSYLAGFFFFFSALIVTVRTDFEHMLISRYASLYLIPCAYILSFMKFIPINITYSIIGSITAYLFLYTLNKIFFYITNKNGLGQGDSELLAFIGSFVGSYGWWISLMIGSFIGSLYGISYMLISRNYSSIKIPFGPFLAFGAMLYVLFDGYFLSLLHSL